MRKMLIIANTYYQLILSIQMKYTIFANDHITLILSNHSNNAREVYRKLKNEKIFNECYYVESKNIDNNISKISKIIDVIKISLNFNNKYDIFLDNLPSRYFDELIFFNIKLFEYESIFGKLYKENNEINVSLFEEGILSYTQEVGNSRRRKIINIIRICTGNSPMLSKLNKFYCFFPEIYKGKLNAIKIPLINTQSLSVNSIKTIFKTENLKYEKKYIFFTSVYDFEGGEPVGEYELVCKVADLVGKENLLVKMHPRDSRSIYKDSGFTVDENSSVPWEAIQLSGDFCDKIFLTINSGSVLSGSTMSENGVKTFYMFKLCNIEGNLSCKKNTYDIENLLKNESMKEVLKTVKIAERLEDIL